MKIIALEEHFQIAAITKAVAKFLPSQMASYHPPDSQLEDLGAGRLKDMETMGIDVQVLSYATLGPAMAQQLRLSLWHVISTTSLRRPLPPIPIALLVLRPCQHLIQRPLPPNSSDV